MLPPITPPGRFTFWRRTIIESEVISMTRMIYKYVSFVVLLLALMASRAHGQPCSDWYVDVILRKNLHCTEQQIDDICTGRRPRPPSMASDCSLPASPSQMPAEGTPYQQFLEFSQVDLNRHPSYTEEYFTQRAHVFCDLMHQGEMMKLTSEITFPPTRWTESPNGRSMLEFDILKVGTRAYCSENSSQEQSFEYTFLR